MKDEIFQKIEDSIYSKLTLQPTTDARLIAKTITEAIQEYDKYKTKQDQKLFVTYAEIPDTLPTVAEYNKLQNKNTKE